MFARQNWIYTSQCQHKAESCHTFNQTLVLLFVFSFSSFVKAKFGALVCLFIDLVPLGQFHFTFVFNLKYLSAILFVLRKSLIVLQYN
jgi:hypothetical protein